MNKIENKKENKIRFHIMSNCRIETSLCLLQIEINYMIKFKTSNRISSMRSVICNVMPSFQFIITESDFD